MKRNGKRRGMARLMALTLTASMVCSLSATTTLASTSTMSEDGKTFTNPVIFADVPDPDVIRVGDVFYMSSTTMHMAPGVPIMKSYDLVNWEIVNYAYDQMEEDDERALKNGKNDYANGSWASSLRYDPYEELYYVTFSCESTNKSYFFVTDDVEKGCWTRSEDVICYDASLLFEDTGTEMKKYIVYPDHRNENVDGTDYTYTSACIREVNADAKTRKVTLGEQTTLIEHANVEYPLEGLNAEGFHAYKIGEYYYFFMIQGQGWQRQEICWRSKSLEPESFEVKKVFIGDIVDSDGNKVNEYTGIAQGGIFQMADGRWYSMLFEDYGAVGRIPVLLPVEWEDGWPIIGNEGTSVDEVLPIPVEGQEEKSIVNSDEFDNGTTRMILDAEDKDTGITAGLTVEALAEMANGSAKNLIKNGDFSNGTESWHTWMAKLSVEEQDGNKVMKVSERQGTSCGLKQDVTLEKGSIYKFTAKIKYSDDTEGAATTKDFTATIQYTGYDENKNETTKYVNTQAVAMKNGEWTTIQGTVRAPEDAASENMIFFFENPWTPATTELDFYVDDVTLCKDELAMAVEKNEYGYNGSNLSLDWQWNHNPNNNLWSLTDREGYLRLKSGLIAENIQTARNTLTQRTYGPTSSANTAMEIGGMKDGDVAGLSSFQNQYGFVGVKMESGKKYLVMHRATKAGDADGQEIERIELNGNTQRVYLRVDCDFRDNAEKNNPKCDDKAYFYYSTDEGQTWTKIGDYLQMVYDWPHFVGQRFGLFYYSTKQCGGYVDFDYFHVSDEILEVEEEKVIRNPYERVEAEDYDGVDDGSALTNETCGDVDGGQNVGYSEEGSYLLYENVNFNQGASKISVRIASADWRGTSAMEFRLDAPDGELIGSFETENTGDWQTYKTVEVDLKNVTGVHDLYMVYVKPFNFNWWQILPAAETTPTPTPTPTPEVKLPFTDVNKDKEAGLDWYYEAVANVFEKGLMTGMNDTYFGAYEEISRAQFAVILYRMEGEPEAVYKNEFPDVKENEGTKWYTSAVAWANKNGLITGYTHNGHFGAADPITREQLATILYRYAQWKGYDLGEGADLNTFNDAAKVSGFAKDALSWAVGNKIITGKDKETRLDPQGTAKRAECAVILDRFLKGEIQ